MSTSRTFCISDVHGNRRTLASLLHQLHLDRERDSLIFIGDLVSRGPDSRGVLDFIFQLQQCMNVVAVRGNHEQLLLDAATSGIHEDYLEFMDNGGETTLQSFGGIDHPARIPIKYLDFMRRMPFFWENESHILVHAGLPCKLTDPISAANKWEMLWTRATWTDPAFLNGKCLVTGHSIKSLKEIQESLNTDHMFVDNGCYLGAGYQEGAKGNLIGVELETKRVWVQRNID